MDIFIRKLFDMLKKKLTPAMFFLIKKNKISHIFADY